MVFLDMFYLRCSVLRMFHPKEKPRKDSYEQLNNFLVGCFSLPSLEAQHEAAICGGVFLQMTPFMWSGELGAAVLEVLEPSNQRLEGKGGRNVH